MSGVVGRVGTKSGLIGKETTLAPPVGTLISVPWGASSVEGFIYCNGGSYNTHTYRDLHALISNTYGGTAYSAGTTDASGASTTFQVPDFRGRFLRGDAGDSDAIGTAQGSQNMYERTLVMQVTPHTGSSDSGYDWGIPGFGKSGPMQNYDTSYPDNYGTFYHPVWKASFGNAPWDTSASPVYGGGNNYGKAYNYTVVPIGVYGDDYNSTSQGLFTGAHSNNQPVSGWANSEARPVNYAVKWFIKWSEV